MIHGDRAEGGLAPRHWAIVREVLRGRPEVEAAALFGSRALGTPRPSSDLDLWVDGAGVDISTTASLAGAFEESHLPFFVDVVHLTEATDPGFAARVRETAWGIELDPPRQRAASGGGEGAGPAGVVPSGRVPER
ncbi:nucleotidyltransferase domain-containing protein [Phycisphaera mikurensis]|uniref:Polymerase beta nucleotidyltransferase domain-containing protein n=1 Tax=Phycisphaera mikurensis (strain NBRC 102666 / KCTC 22515 / FYK2301M01) TaxID=1142394 RepID=I0IAQ0_PHYMF|nr:nucleotidyltransferase domain-containing protein [Phycisphaera mikurensis]MBB6441667.1 putative nucleotidyltransferase [Phycisphaera mikurensis]BAM02338.1 hypothetical protein PSMK_01790 [Phycisphaera mikurensis NBRC 102666]